MRERHGVNATLAEARNDMGNRKRLTSEEEREFFSNWADHFTNAVDAAIAKSRFRRGQLFRQAAIRNIPPGGKILDYGCGPGRITRLLGEAGYDVHGVDWSPGMIERAKQDCAQTQKPRFSVCDGIFTGLDHTVDGIVCSSVVEYVDDPGALLRCFAASLKKGGTLLLSFANRRSLWGLYSRLRNRNTAPHFQVQKHIWSFRQCRVVLEKAGFTLTEPVEYFESPLDPYPLMRPIARTALFGTLGLVVGKML